MSKPTTNNKQHRYGTLKRLLSISHPEIGRIVAGLSALLVNSLTNLSFPYIMGKAVDRLSNDTTTTTTTNDNNNETYYFIITTTGVFIVGSIASWVRVYCLGTATKRISSKLRKQLFNSYIDKNIEFFNTLPSSSSSSSSSSDPSSSSSSSDPSSSSSGELITILDKDIEKASEAITDKFAAGLRSINSSLNGSILLFMTSPQLCGVSLGIVPLVGIGAMTLRKYSKKISESLRKLESNMLSFALERFSHISTIRLNGREILEKKTFANYIDSSYTLAENNYFAQGAFMSFLNMSTNLSLAGVLFVGGGLIARNKMTPGGLTRFAIQSAFVGLGFSGLSTFYSDMTTSLDAAKRVFDAVDNNNSKQDDDDDNNNKSNKLSIDTMKSYPFKIGSIEISSVSFSFLSRELPVLSNVTLTINPNGITAIVGKSGSGKSTLMSILCGLYKPMKGNVYLDGIDITTVDQKWLRSQIGVVEQRVGLLSGTIRDNIAYGKENANENDIINAAKKAYAHDFIMSFPDKYDTQVGVNGVLLSGGQAARIAIARAIVKQPKYLLLDEATASLDQDSEKQIIDVLNNINNNDKTTVIVFTHSDTLMNAAKDCHVLMNGAIVASGDYSKIATYVNN